MIERTYTPTSRPHGFSWSGFSTRAYTDLLRGLVAAQMKIRYGYTAVGVGWAVLNPMLQMLVYAFIFGSIFSDEQAHFRMYLLAGLLPWQAFSWALNACVSSLVNQSDLLKKAPFPSELLPISAVINAIITQVIVMAFFVAFLVIRSFPALDALHWVLVAIVIEFVFLCGLALITSCLNVFFRDIEQLLSFGVWLWFFMTPIVYPLSRLDAFEQDVVLYGNPMAAIVTTMQNALLEGAGPPGGPLAVAAIIAVVTLIGGWAIFRRFQYELPKVA